MDFFRFYSNNLDNNKESEGGDYLNQMSISKKIYCLYLDYDSNGYLGIASLRWLSKSEPSQIAHLCKYIFIQTLETGEESMKE